MTLAQQPVMTQMSQFGEGIGTGCGQGETL